MKNIIKYLGICICSFILFNTNVFAASYSVSVTSSSVTVGNSVTLTISGNDLAGKFYLKSSNTSVAKLSNDSVWIDNNSQSITITTSTAGTATISIVPEDVTNYDGETVTGNKSVTITVNKKQSNNSNSSTNSYVPPKKSTNNYLSSLTVDGYSLDKDFNKETLEYSTTVPASVEKVTINAQLDDSSAKVSGTGEKEVKTGENVFELKVTAENGDVKTYKLIVNVLEATTVKIDDKKYTIIEKDDALELIEGYDKTIIKINDEEVVGYYNEKTKYNLVILKDEEGNIDYYLYENNKYSLYKEYNFSGLRLHLLDTKTPDNYVERELTIDNDKIKAYQLDTNKKNATYALDTETVSNYYLVYAMNINTGNKNYYLIDKLENTAIRYDEELNNLFLNINKDESNYKNYFFITLGAVGVVLVITGITFIVTGRKKKNKLNFK